MDYRQLYKAIKDDTLNGFYLFTGEEEHVKHSALNALTSACLSGGPADLNLTILQGAASAQTFIESCETLPLMSKHRVTVWHDCPLLLSNTKLSVEGEDNLISYVKTSNLFDGVAVFCVRGAADKRKRLYTQLKSSGQIVDFDALGRNDLAKWIQKKCADAGLTITQDAVDMLIGDIGPHIADIDRELEKAICFAGPGSVVTQDAVNRTAVKNVESSVFFALDMLLRKKTDAGLSAFSALMRESGPFALLGAITSSIRTLYLVKEMLAQKKNTAEIEKTLALNPYRLRRVIDQAAPLNVDSLKKMLLMCGQCDQNIKSGQMSEDNAFNSLLFGIIDSV